MHKHFEREIPSGYTEALKLDATSKKLGLLLNLINLVIVAVVLVPMFITLRLADIPTGALSNPNIFWLVPLIVLTIFLVYMVLHELVHGIAYKTLTGERLTFGITWSVAFCGVPKIYVRKACAVISCAAPLVVFSIIFGALTVAAAFIDRMMLTVFWVSLALHLGGCVGDMYVILLMMTKFRGKDVLMNDTGPVQTFFVREETERKSEEES